MRNPLLSPPPIEAAVSKLDAIHADIIESQRQVIETMQQQLDNYQPLRVELDKAFADIRRLQSEHDAIKAENDAKTADLRRLQKEIDPDEIKLRIMYAADVATAPRMRSYASCARSFNRLTTASPS